MDLGNGDQILSLLESIYKPEVAGPVYAELIRRLEGFSGLHREGLPAYSTPLSERDSLVITYPDQVTDPGVKPLVSLSAFADRYLQGVISGMHILPFFPATSDDGFAISDYQMVDPGLGTWREIKQLSLRFRLMIDAVINHVSTHHPWFQGFLAGDPQYQGYFITVPKGTDLSSVVRPRSLPLLTAFTSGEKKVQVWTTFSRDQVDLNFHDPQVLLEIIEVLLLFVAIGAQLIRLDAIAYLWKEPGTPSIHLPQTHAIVRLFRAVMDQVAPYVLLVTETNVPHQENLSYFGNEQDEAQLVYNFSLPPLVLHAFLTGCARDLSAWAANLALPSPNVTFLNFLASHDGIGINPARGLLSETEIEKIIATTLERGGLLGKKTVSGGEMVYELNINYFDALNDEQLDEPLEKQIDRFMAAQAILLAMQGVPAIYFHSFVGSRGWPEGVRLTGMNRTINRQKFERAALEAELNNPQSRQSRVYQRFVNLLRARSASTAFNPYGSQKVLNLGEGIFALQRISPSNHETITCLHNVTDRTQTVHLDQGVNSWRDTLSHNRINLDRSGELHLAPYQVMWLAPLV